MTELERTLLGVFQEDHQILTRGLHAVLEALRRGDDDAARALAESMDRDAGAHMQFEEQVFYPELRARLGDEFVDQLYREHAIGQRAVRALLSSEGAQLTNDARRAIIGQLETAHEHVLSCGTIASALAELAPAQQDEMLARLDAMRTRHRRWTDLGRDET